MKKGISTWSLPDRSADASFSLARECGFDGVEVGISDKGLLRLDSSEKELYEICKSLCKMGAVAVIISGLERGEFLENFVFEQGKEPQITAPKKIKTVF